MHAFSLGRRSPPTAPSSSEASSSIVDALGASEEARLAHKGANVAASIADELRRLSPDGEFLQRGHEFVADEPTQLLRWVGEPSFCRLVGLRLGAPDAGPAWDHFAEDPRLLEAIGQDILQLVPTTAERNALVRASLLTVGSRRLLNPSNARGWGLLRAVARSLYEAATATDPERTASENYTEQMGRCWAWCAKFAMPPRPHNQRPSRTARPHAHRRAHGRAPLAQGHARDGAPVREAVDRAHAAR